MGLKRDRFSLFFLGSQFYSWRYRVMKDMWSACPPVSCHPSVNHPSVDGCLVARAPACMWRNAPTKHPFVSCVKAYFCISKTPIKFKTQIDFVIQWNNCCVSSRAVLDFHEENSYYLALWGCDENQWWKPALVTCWFLQFSISLQSKSGQKGIYFVPLTQFWVNSHAFGFSNTWENNKFCQII